MRARLSALALLLPLLAAACSSQDDTDPGPDPDPDPDPGFWLVGDGGTMLGVTTSGEATGYPLDAEHDLLAIACFGRATAYVVGEAGTVLRTRDAGQTWDALALGQPFTASEDWQALAAAEATPEGVETVWLVGHAAAVARTEDGGASWDRVAGVDGDLTGVATRADGELALAVGDDGEIWRLEPGGATLVHQAAVGLSGIAMSSHDDRVVAVGVGGMMLESTDGGEAWVKVELPTTADLHAVRVSGHGELSLAVGAAGVVVRREDGVTEITTVADADAGLYGLHLRHDGTGQAVGGAGVLLQTGDSGRTWRTVGLPTTAKLRGVDDFHEGGHL